MTQRIPCKNENCAATILPATAAKTGGICMPCHQEQERQKRQAYIEKHRRTVNLYENVTNPVEILKIMHSRITYDPLIQYVPYPLSKEQLYASLSAEEMVQMQEYALHLLEANNEDEELCRDILASLVCYRNVNIADCLPQLMEKEMYDPGVLYKDASPEVRNRILEQVEWDEENRNLMLLALAWIGDEPIMRKFREWSDNKPDWAEQMYVSPEYYAREAGWELTLTGNRRDLVHDRSFAVTSFRGMPLSGEGSIFFVRKNEASCPWCCGPLTTLMDADTHHPALAYLDLTSERLQVNTCMNCGCYGVIYMEYDAWGQAYWSGVNVIPEYLGDVMPEEYSEGFLPAEPQLTCSFESRSAYYASIWEMSQQSSQLGGHPSWVQDAQYPDCPRCGQSMHFIGQLDGSDLEAYGEGIYYMFICTEDRMTATTYQQS
ncbi:DUF1963 domain-containing protein [Paenibacillus sp. HJL G12]|uniref:DUF1963 domain-containing protein n=1 Tax=Paenibacillus dendrobii TaxID=2691084 RepID=A0A7X3IGQ9_9BACL|nr:DUF1963 domain-containing protein [Paenibacillus dendrobii]MWV43136.1 DUF1963 domain-containing protein [Paenibacillus dendrobii]